ncbi:MAG TPA: four-helix bundle copper-binding protein [Gemmatimonadales bacterium]
MPPDQTPHAEQSSEHEVHDRMDECIEACLQGHVVCTMTAQYALTQGGEHATVDRVGLLLDCAEICQTSANFMVRGSPYHTLTCGACAEVCRACADMCREMEDDEHMRSCAEICERCAELCEEMAIEGDLEEDEEDED